jgi:hypothetical protein
MGVGNDADISDVHAPTILRFTLCMRACGEREREREREVIEVLFMHITFFFS